MKKNERKSGIKSGKPTKTSSKTSYIPSGDLYDPSSSTLNDTKCNVVYVPLTESEAKEMKKRYNLLAKKYNELKMENAELEKSYAVARCMFIDSTDSIADLNIENIEKHNLLLTIFNMGILRFFFNIKKMKSDYIKNAK